MNLLFKFSQYIRIILQQQIRGYFQRQVLFNLAKIMLNLLLKINSKEIEDI